MPRYYCDYCDTYLTHDSPSVRKQHNSGYKHKANVRSYYQQFEEQQTQSLIDQKIKEHLGQTAAFSQVGVVYNQHLASFPPRPRPPILPLPNMPMPHGMRPPMFPQPVPGMPGYGSAPVMPPMISPPGAPSVPMQNGLPRPPLSGTPTTTPGVSVNGAPPPMSSMPVMYPTTPTRSGGGFDGYNNASASSAPQPATSTATAPQDDYSFAQALENSR